MSGRKNRARRRAQTETSLPKGGPAEESRTLSPWVAGAIVFLIALALRLVALVELRDVPLFRSPQLDSLEYFSWARVVAAGDLRWPASPPHGPGYPFFLAAMLVMFDQSLFAARVVQAIVGALTCTLVFEIARKRFGAGAGMAAGLAIAAYGPFILLDISILSEGLMIFLLVAATAILLAPLSIPRLVAAGLLIGLAGTVRPTALALLAVGFLILARDRSAMRWRIIAAGVLLLAAIVPIAPVTALNWKKSGAFIPVQAHGALNLYYGNSPSGTGIADQRVGGAWTALAREAKRRGLHGAEEDRYFIRKTIDEIKRSPASWLRLLGSKTAWLVSNTEIRDSHSYYFFQQHSRVLQLAIPFAGLFGLFAIGLFASLRRGDVVYDLLAIAVIFSLTFIGLLVGSRYRAPVIPVLALFAGAGVLYLVAAYRSRDYRQLALAAIIGVISSEISLIPKHRPSYQFAEEWEFTGRSLFAEDRVEEADEAFRKALELDPRHAQAWFGRATVAQSATDFVAAEQRVRRALEIDPGNDRAHYLAGILLERRNATAEAIREYETALSLEPQNLLAARRLAESLVRAGRIAEAARVYERILDPIQRDELLLRPDDAARIELRAAEMYGALGQFEKGIEHADRAARLDPDNASAWTLLGMLSIDARQLDRARQALRRAEESEGGEATTLLRARLAFVERRYDEVEAILAPIVERAPNTPGAAALLAAARSAAVRATQ